MYTFLFERLLIWFQVFFIYFMNFSISCTKENLKNNKFKLKLFKKKVITANEAQLKINLEFLKEK